MRAWLQRKCHHLSVRRRPSANGVFVVSTCRLCRSQLGTEFTRHQLSRRPQIIDVEVL